MTHFFAPQPVGIPGLIVLLVGSALFFAALIRATLSRDAGDSGKKSGVSRIGIGLQMAGFAITGFGPVRGSLPPAGPHAIGEAVAVALLMGGAFALFRAATRAMGANWSIAARMRDDHQLVTSGVFARLRHPIYTGMALFLAALAIGLGHYANLIAGVPLFAAGSFLRIREEERLLREKFGAAYDSYAASVRRFIPGLV
jgi:protein-S-isoprenylcysteine O-methyltransferase Ste14